MIDANTGIYRLNEKVKFFGFVPNREQKNLVQLFLDRIWLKSPSYSSTSVNFFCDGDNYHGEILITSGERLFIAKDIAHDLVNLVPKLERKISRQLRQWRKNRSVLPQARNQQSIRILG